MEGPHWKNKAYSGEALPLNDANAEAIFKRRCPVLYNTYKDPNNPDGKATIEYVIDLIYMDLFLPYYSSYGIMLRW